MTHDQSAGHLLTIQLFGPLIVQCGGQALPKVRSRKGVWLLALLALRANKPVPREWLAGTLWPDSDIPRETLRRTLTDLRAALGTCGCSLAASTQSVTLRIAEADVDVRAFDNLIRAGDLASLEQALALYKGPLLEGCCEVWSDGERMVRAEAYLLALQTAAQLHIEAHRTAPGAGDRLQTAITYLRRAIQADPYRENLYRDLMHGLVANGEAAEAIQIYRGLRLFLHAATRSEPSAETVALYNSIRSTGPRRAAAVEPKPEAEAARSEPPPTNMPRPLTPLLGRELELDHIADGLVRSRLLTIAGMGGLGKTRLAIEAAGHLREQFPDGVWFIDLAAISDPALVSRAVAGVLSVREETDRDLVHSLIEFARTRHMLLVIDNCEHLLDSCARLVRALVIYCRQLHVLTTSRQALGLTGEVLLRLEPLGLPEPCSDDGDMAIAIQPILDRSPVIRLFVDRAVAVQPSFSLSARNLAAVTEICRRLEGIPLAVELAAARVKCLSPDQISRRLEDRFRLLTDGDRAAPVRQHTLRALIDWSYDQLDPREQLLLSRLSVFAGGWTLEAVEQVTTDSGSVVPADDAEGRRFAERGFSSEENIQLASHGSKRSTSWICDVDVLDLLSSLADKSLILVESMPDGEIRYRMLETLRQYACEKLEEIGETSLMRRRHAHFFLQFAESAEPEMRGPNQTRRLRDAMRDNDNLRQALRAFGPGVERLRLASALFWHWYIHGFYAEGRAWLTSSLEESPEAPRAVRCKARKAAGDLSWAMGDMDAARELHLQNMQSHRAADDRQGIAVTFNSLGLVAYHQGDCSGAAEYYRQGLELIRPLGDRVMTGVLLMNLALPTKDRGDYADAEALLSEADAINRETGNRQGLGTVLHSRCLIAKRLGDYARARKFIEEAIEIDRDHQNLQGEAVNLHTMGEIAFYQGDLDFAEQCYLGSLERFRQVGSRRFIAAALCSLGEVFSARGDPAKAREYHLESIEMELALNNQSGIATSLRCLAAIEQTSGQSGRAARMLAAVEAACERQHTPMPPNQQADYDRLVSDVRNSLGKTAFQEQWKRGAEMSLEDAVAEALLHVTVPSTTAPEKLPARATT